MTYALIEVWSETKHSFLGCGSIEYLKGICGPKVTDWKPNGVGGFTSKKEHLVIKEWK